MPLFIRQNDELPVARLGYGPTCPGFEFRGNRLLVDDEDEALLTSLRANGFEEVADDDPRRAFIIDQGWDRLSQRRYAIENPPPEEPTE